MNKTIKSELVLVKKELLEIKNRNEVNPENILKEVLERSVKSNNVIIFDLVESNNDDIRERIKQDVDLVKELLAAADIAPEQVSKVLRLGKKGKVPKNRPTKVVFTNSAAASKALLLRSNIIETCKSKISLQSDQTEMQRNHYRTVCSQLE
ncbi:hypothetical protein HHI36_017934 [Cryptolaemus montrouzieri]|uniref:Uncharacterized protein n=1 Tax=Cryptolaemus montrouzieri TaxID=559131 RepID=A0ABD2NZ70_9CUCU